jgi:DNA-binding CsgD family transcriptional regulator
LIRVHPNNHFLSTGGLSGIHLMLRQTGVKPEMPRARAAICDTSITLPPPFDENRLLAIIQEAVERARRQTSDAAELEKLQSRFNSLSRRQRQLMELAAAGLSSKEIGARLKISAKTIENHRAWVIERIGARNLAELVRMAMQIQRQR